MIIKTFTAEAVVQGGPNKLLMAFLNAPTSGVTAKLWRWAVLVADSSGQDVVLDYELRKITAFTGGTPITAARMRSSLGPELGCSIVSLPASATDIATEEPLVMSAVWQINSALAPQGMFVATQASPICDPLVLEQGQGFSITQIDNNTSTMRLHVTFTCEPV